MEDIHDIKPPIELPILTQNLINLFWVFLSAVLLIIFLILILYIWKKYKKNKINTREGNAETKKDVQNYNEIILKKFIDLKKYLANREIKQFHIEASRLLREYLSFQYKYNFTDLTSKEILSNEKISKKQKEKLEDFFKVSDLVKFARLEESLEEAKKIYSLLESIIK